MPRRPDAGARGHRSDRHAAAHGRGDGRHPSHSIPGPDDGTYTYIHTKADRAMAGYHDAYTHGADTCTGRNRDARANLHTKADTGPVTRVLGDPATRSQRKHTATNLHTYTGPTRGSHVHNSPA